MAKGSICGAQKKYTRVTGSRACVMGLGLGSVQNNRNMKGSGSTRELMDSESWSMLEEIGMKDNGRSSRSMGSGRPFSQMVIGTLEGMRMESFMGTGSSHGQMEASTREIFSKEPSREEERGSNK